MGPPSFESAMECPETTGANWSSGRSVDWICVAAAESESDMFPEKRLGGGRSTSNTSGRELAAVVDLSVEKTIDDSSQRQHRPAAQFPSCGDCGPPPTRCGSTADTVRCTDGVRARRPSVPPVAAAVRTEGDLISRFDEKSPAARAPQLPRGRWSRVYRAVQWAWPVGVLPGLEFMRTYNWQSAIWDASSGLTVGITSVPMGVGYALLANLPGAVGLHCNFIYPLIYSMLGTGSSICVGTSAIESMLVAESVASLVGWDAPERERVATAAMLSVVVGAIHVLLRMLRLGVVANLLADPVLSAFSTGSAITIASSQLTHILGVAGAPRGASLLQTWIHVFRHVSQAQGAAVAVATSSFAILLLPRIVGRRCGWCAVVRAVTPLVALASTGFVVYWWGFPVNTAGELGSGLPRPSFELPPPLDPVTLLLRAVTYAFLLVVIHAGICKTLAAKTPTAREIDINQEFLALGACSLTGSIFRCFPVATSMSRSCIAHMTGSKTPLYNIANSLTVVLALTTLTSLLAHMTMPSLGAIIVLGVLSMTSFGDAWRLLRIRSLDFLLWISCFLATLFWNPTGGIIVGVGMSILWLVKKSVFPPIVTLGQLPGTPIFRNVERFPAAREFPGCKILRLDASLNFASAPQLEKRVYHLALEQEKSQANRLLCGGCHKTAKANEDIEKIRVLIIDASSVNDVDATALRILKNMSQRLQANECHLLFANWKGPHRDLLQRSGFYETVPPQSCFLTLHDALFWAENVYLTPPPLSTEKSHITLGEATTVSK